MTAAGVARLVALHAPVGEPGQHTLPSHGTVTVGRRLTCSVVCGDVAVSGVHCVIVVTPGARPGDATIYEVEDRSTNGTFLNEVRLDRGHRARLSAGGVLSLTKPVDADGKPTEVSAVRFRFEFELPTVAPAAAAEGSAAVEDSVRGQTSDGYIRELLGQEQRSRAKISSELALAQVRLSEEREQRAALQQELDKAQAALLEERRRCTEARATRGELQSEFSVLRQDREQLQSLLSEHAALGGRKDKLDVELEAQGQRLLALTEALERQKTELENVRLLQNGQPLGDLQGQLKREQDRVEAFTLEECQEHKNLEATSQEVECLKWELSTLTSAKEHLSKELAQALQERERAEQRQQAARESLEKTARERAELEARVAALRAEAEAARAAARAANGGRGAEARRSEALCALAGRFAEATRGYVDGWARGLLEAAQDVGSHSFLPSAARLPPPAPRVSASVPLPVPLPAIEVAAAAAAAAAAETVVAVVAGASRSPEVNAASAVSAAGAAAPAESSVVATVLESAVPSIARAMAGSSPGSEARTRASAQHVPLAERQQQPVECTAEDALLPPLAEVDGAFGAVGAGGQLPLPDQFIGTKRSATMSILVMPDLQAAFKRPRPAVRR